MINKQKPGTEKALDIKAVVLYYRILSWVSFSDSVKTLLCLEQKEEEPGMSKSVEENGKGLSHACLK